MLSLSTRHPIPETTTGIKTIKVYAKVIRNEVRRARNMTPKLQF